MSVPVATTSAKGAEGDAVDDGSAGEVRSVDAIKDARKLAEGVMGKVRGTAPPDDPSSSPIKRLEAQMAGGSCRGEKVTRSPKEVRAIARSIAEEIGEDSDEVIAMIKLRGRLLVKRYGLTQAAERIADMFYIDCLSAVVRALETSSSRSK